MARGRTRTRTKTRGRSKKRAYIRKMRLKKAIKPDGMVKEKITIEKPIYSDTASAGYHRIHWFTQVPFTEEYNTGMATPSIASNTQFKDMMRNY